ncbi:hypothetical protein PCANC_27501 [Puccinia coronata f. sp. avenae]|uniref:F-box domain-containing protein n=1 Tax=Puccinia coronata f. sp. avenae TaxID=200324 RepID=A0A2N5RY41_9BASI|nr:hypothetical protein PCANC_27501 [Puccinia coronata f. sp. avenae]
MSSGVTQGTEVQSAHYGQVPRKRLSKLLSSVQNRTLVHQAERLLKFESPAGDSPNSSKVEGLRSPSKWAKSKHAASLDSSNPTSRLKRQLSECSKATRSMDATPLGLGVGGTYEEAKLNLQGLATGNFSPRAFTSKRSTASLPYATHLIPREILTESLPQKPADNYIFRALPEPPIELERQPPQSRWTTALGRSSSAPTRVRFADPIVEYSPPHSGSRSYQFSQLGISARSSTSLHKTEPNLPPKSCIKSVSRLPKTRKKLCLSDISTDRVSPRKLSDSSLEEDLRDSISFMADWIFPREHGDESGSNRPSEAGVAKRDRTRCLSSRTGSLSLNNNVEKDIRSGSTSRKPVFDEPRCLQQGRRHASKLSAPCPLPLQAKAFLSSSTPLTSSIPGSQPSPQNSPSPSCHLEKDCNQYANVRRDISLKFAMSPKIKRIEVTSNVGSTDAKLQQAKKTLSGDKLSAGKSYQSLGSGQIGLTYSSQSPSSRRLEAVSDLPSPIVDEGFESYRTTGTLHLEAEHTRNQRSSRERTDKNPTLSPHSSSRLRLPPQVPHSPARNVELLPPSTLVSRDLKSVASLRTTDIGPEGACKNLMRTPQSVSPEEGDVCSRAYSRSDTAESPEYPHADSRFSSPSSISSEAPSTSSLMDFSPVPSPKIQLATAPDSWNDLASDNFDNARNHYPEPARPSIADELDDSSSRRTLAEEQPCTIVNEIEKLLQKDLKGSPTEEAKIRLENEDDREMDCEDDLSEPEPIPHKILDTFGEKATAASPSMWQDHPSELAPSTPHHFDVLDMFGEKGEDQIAVVKAQDPKTKEINDSTTVDTDLSEFSATICPKPRCFCTSSKRWANWDLYLNEEESLKCSSQGSTTERSSLSSQTEESILWDAAPKIDILKPDHEYLFSELKSPPIYPEGFRFSSSSTRQDLEFGADSPCFPEIRRVEDHETLEPFMDCSQRLIQLRRYTDRPSEDEDQRQLVHLSNQGYMNNPLSNQATPSKFTARFVQPPIITGSCLPVKISKENDRPEKLARQRRKQDSCTATASQKVSDDRALSSPGTISTPSGQPSQLDPVSGSCIIITKFEFSVLRFPHSILRRILMELGYKDFFRLSQVSRVLRVGFGVGEVKETILKVFLSGFGYCDGLGNLQTRRVQHRFRRASPTIAWDGGDLVLETNTSKIPLLIADTKFELAAGTDTSDRSRLDLTPRMRKIDTANPLDINLQELHAFYYFHEAGEERLLQLATQPTNQEGWNNFTTIQAYCRAHNKLVIRARLLFDESSNPIPPSYPLRIQNYPTSLFCPGQAAVFRLWIPCTTTRMSKCEMLKCEVEVLRSGIRSLVQRGDIFFNLALGSSGDVGKLIYDVN